MPIIFLNVPKSHPVLPPTDASTMASRVVGTSSSRAPRLKVDAAKAVISQITPPPIPINVLERCRLLSNAIWTIFSTFSIVLNDSVVLGTGAFSKNAGSYDYAIENLTLSSDLTHYTKNVFEGSSIRDLRISVGSESLEVGEEAFKNTSIYNCWIEDGITAIGAGAFEWDSTSSITYMEGSSFGLPDTIVEIGDRAFAGVTGSFTITLPEQLEIIGNAAFEGCSFLSLDGAFSPSLRIIGDGAFRNTRAMSPSILTFNEGLEKIGDEAFANTSVWDNVRLVIPSTVKSIGTNAFNDFFYYYDGQSVQILSKTLNAFSPGYPWGIDSDISIIWGENEIV